MKGPWTKEAEATLKKMAYAGASNKEIADAVGRTLESVHAKRSRMGLTIAAVEAQQAATANESSVKKKKAATEKPVRTKEKTETPEGAAAKNPVRRFEITIREL